MSDEKRPKSKDPRRTHPGRNILLNSVGINEDVQVDTDMRRLKHGDYVLLCSDGLWEYIEDDELQQITTSTPDPQQACDKLVALANERGGSDNISVVIVKFG